MEAAHRLSETWLVFGYRKQMFAVFETLNGTPCASLSRHERGASKFDSLIHRGDAARQWLRLSEKRLDRFGLAYETKDAISFRDDQDIDIVPLGEFLEDCLCCSRKSKSRYSRCNHCSSLWFLAHSHNISGRDGRNFTCFMLACWQVRYQPPHPDEFKKPSYEGLFFFYYFYFMKNKPSSLESRALTEGLKKIGLFFAYQYYIPNEQ